MTLAQQAIAQSLREEHLGESQANYTRLGKDNQMSTQFPLDPVVPTAEDGYKMTVQWGGFLQDIEKFNEMYRLPVPASPTLRHARFEDFRKILQEEVDECDDISLAFSEIAAADKDTNEYDVLTMAADWLGDIVIYAMNEMRRLGLKPDAILSIIMQSNFSKLDEEGNPIYDERGKVMKGPNYWKPEPKIREYIEGKMNQTGGV
jgi:hypothetical protein